MSTATAETREAAKRTAREDRMMMIMKEVKNNVIVLAIAKVISKMMGEERGMRDEHGGSDLC